MNPSMRGSRQVDPATRDYLDRAANLAGKPLAEMSVDEARAFMQAGQSVRYGHPALSIESASIAGVSTRIVRPCLGSSPLPVVIYLHGGGWVLGSPDTHAGIVQELALSTGAAFVVPDYCLAPEQPFPAAFEQCRAVAQGICSDSCPNALDASRVAIAGDSAGGNLAAVVALDVALSGAAELRLQALICPALDPELRCASYAEFAEGFDLTTEAMRWFWSQYTAGPAQATDRRLSPLHVPAADLARVAPAFVLTAGCDVLRDEAELYATRLWDAGVEATVVRIPGAIHNFPVIDELRESPSGQAALGAISHALTQALALPTHVSAGYKPQRTNQE